MVSKIAGNSTIYPAAYSCWQWQKHQSRRVTTLCKGNPIVTGGFHFQRPVIQHDFPHHDSIMKGTIHDLFHGLEDSCKSSVRFFSRPFLQRTSISLFPEYTLTSYSISHNLCITVYLCFHWSDDIISSWQLMWHIHIYPSGIHHWHRGNHMIAPVPVM